MRQEGASLTLKEIGKSKAAGALPLLYQNIKSQTL